MIRSYYRTLMVKDLTKATVELSITEKPKYEAIDEQPTEVKYTGVTSWDIIEGGQEAEEIEAQTDAESADENHEYLVLHFENGDVSTFRNSHVSMFIW